jgi:VIT1/CCC1 family predicted Fe2+/Mn2+ transporter
MPDDLPRKHILDPISRVSEILFGLIMALSFTGSLSAALADQKEVHTMLIGAIGCNIAWGLIDAVMHLITTLTERARQLSTLCTFRATDDPANIRAQIASALPPRLAAAMTNAELESLAARAKSLPPPPARPRLDKHDFLAALAIFFLVALSTFPVVIPFMLLHQPQTALRISNGIALVMLFLCGFRLGHFSGNRPWVTGIAMAIVGTALVALTIALGG